MSFKSILLNLLGDGAVRRKICSIASACSGGGTISTADAPLSYDPDTKELEITPGTSGQVLSTDGTTVFWEDSSVTGATWGTITGTLSAQTDLQSVLDSKLNTSLALALGETSTTAYRGDRGKTAYDHSQLTSGTNPHNTTFANIASKPTNVSGYGITDAIVQGGNTFGLEPSIGSNDNFSVGFRVNSFTVAKVNSSGIFTGIGISNLTTANNSRVLTQTTGVMIDRNVADATTLVKFNHINASSTGLIAEFQKAGATLASVNNAGKITTVEDIEITTIAKGLIIKSPDGTRYRIVVANGGALSTIPA